MPGQTQVVKMHACWLHLETSSSLLASSSPYHFAGLSSIINSKNGTYQIPLWLFLKTPVFLQPMTVEKKKEKKKSELLKVEPKGW
jgi:hypothetical protein